MELFKAHYQWATRPADQRFASLTELYKVTKAYATQSGEKLVPVKQLHVQDEGNDLVLQRIHTAMSKDKRQPQPARFTNWAYKQLCTRISAPAEYVASLPAQLASKCLNAGLTRYNADTTSNRADTLNLLFHVNGGLVLRALTTEIYERFWNYELAERLLQLEAKGWEPARPDFNADDNAKNQTAVYASDHDMFVFLRMRNCYVQQPVATARTERPLYRGVIYWNSEVGASVLGCMFFYYNAMCGNHIIWGASEVNEIKVRHVGRIRERVHEFELKMAKYANDSDNEMQQRLKAAATKRIAATKDEVLDILFGLRNTLKVSRRDLEASYSAVLPQQDGDPLTVWGMAQGMTRHSQTSGYTDQRMELDKAAGRLLQMVDKF